MVKTAEEGPPRIRSRRASAVFLVSFAFLANIPDAPLPGWGHNLYRVSHSLFVSLTAIACGVAILGLWQGPRRAIGGWRVMACAAAAWLSHFLLDTFYVDGNGLAMFWPISDASVSLPLPWFEFYQGGGLANPHSWRIGLIEAAFYGAPLAVCVLIRWALSRRRLGDAPMQPVGADR